MSASGSKPTEQSTAAPTAEAGALQRLGELTATLSGAPGAKALLRRFGDVMLQSFDVSRMGFARFSGKGTERRLKARAVTIDGVATFSAEEWESLGAALASSGLSHDRLRDGLTHLTVGGKTLALTLVEDPNSKAGTLVAWTPAKSPTAFDAYTIEHLVRHLQNESRWFRRLDKTQALLYRDDLTGLYNTRYFDITLEAELRRADRFQNHFCLLFIDMDGFKPINDQHGHLSGSSVLKQVAEVIRDAVREVDVPIRYGGDEFIVLLLGASCAKGQLAAERVRRRVEQKEFKVEDGGTARLTCSIGVAAYPEHGKDRETLLKMADETMYDSKRAGKNRVTVVGVAST